MKLCGVLVLLSTLSVAYGLKCYQCLLVPDANSCTEIVTCPAHLDRCGSLSLSGVITKGCESSLLCKSPIKCCSEDLCNSAIPTGSSVLLLLVSAAITTVFL
uniref:lymphocyte antigen 6B-like n=1 Tax=Scatophagus argus TaxID=75038 RepID=UPI001ED8139D|nr:lymphocyte antigen 6B-like [Scatophagus argus]